MVVEEMARVMAWNVMRIGNLGRMGVLWTLALLYSYLHLLFLYPRLRRSPYSVPQSWAAASDLKPASIVTGVWFFFIFPPAFFNLSLSFFSLGIVLSASL